MKAFGISLPFRLTAIPSHPVPSRTGPLLDSSSPINPPFKLPQPINPTSPTPHFSCAPPSSPSFPAIISNKFEQTNGSRADVKAIPQKTEPSIPSSQKTDCWIPDTSLDWLRMLHRWVCFISASLAMWEFSARLFIFQVRTVFSAFAKREEGQLFCLSGRLE
jgi:hypothetical protein